MIWRDELNESVRATLAASTGLPTGLLRVPPRTDPEKRLTQYLIVYPGAVTPAQGSMEGDDDWNAAFLITCVGEDGRQTGWTSDRVKEAMIEGPPPAGESFAVTSRRVVSLGAIVPAGDLFTSQDTYMIRIGEEYED